MKEKNNQERPITVLYRHGNACLHRPSITAHVLLKYVIGHYRTVVKNMQFLSVVTLIQLAPRSAPPENFLRKQYLPQLYTIIVRVFLLNPMTQQLFTTFATGNVVKPPEARA